MNLYALIVLLALLVQYGVEMLSALLNLRALRTDLPEEFEGIYDADGYEQSQRYTRERTRFSLIASTFQLAVLLAFWFLGGFAWLDTLCRGLGLGTIGAGLVYIGALVLGSSLLGLPFSLYSTFVIEERYGFNRTTPKTFALDLLKSLLLSVLLGTPLLVGVLWFFLRFPDTGWLYAWLAVTVFMLFAQYIAPSWIMPWFNRYEPLSDERLEERIRELAQRVGFPLKGVYVMDGSKRSSKANAFFTGFGRHKRIVLFDTLIEKQEPEELLAVLAHEMGHFKKRHIVQNTVLSVLHTGILFWLLGYFLQAEELYRAFYVDGTPVYAGLVFFGLLYTPVELVLTPLLLALSRRHEYQADAFAAETTGDPESLIGSLKKLSRDSLSNLTPHRLHTALHYSHPPVLERIRALRSFQAG